jgi:hypothetical protein
MADTPKHPKKAKEADVADPGETAEIKTKQDKTKQLEPGSTKLEPSEDSDEEEETKEEDSHWVGIRLKDEDGDPVADEPFRLKLPDGTIVEGYLDSKGEAEIHGIPEGQCEVCFPQIDKDVWRPA